ncbi:MAG TPA: aldo/keto reductase [Terricaulis sp.]|jgi:Predicted oxidoreductases (related to aryl-alcohol dehydrogenases)|nr:aldo/keto reductase [Terricaulis sp.]
MKTKRLGAAGPQVFAMGLGCMGMSDFYGSADETESVATIHAALEAGVTLLDTGDFYGVGHNEMLIREALKGGRREKAVLSVKFGLLRHPNGGVLGLDMRPANVKAACAYSLKRLGADYIDIYRPCRVTADVPVEDTIGAIADLVKEGYVRHIGLSEAGPDAIRRAHTVHPICDLQIEYSILSRGPERAILPVLRELGIGMTAYGVLSRGLISESALVGGSASGFRAGLPRFQGENLRHNLTLVQSLKTIAGEKRVTVAQLAIAWVAAQGDDIVPLVGARNRDRLWETMSALDVALSPNDIARIADTVPAGSVAGDRYPTEHMAHLDSER